MNNRLYYSLPKYQDVFTFENLYKAATKCYKNVKWKTSVQKCILNTYRVAYSLYLQLNNKTYETSKYIKFLICERGKMRKIQAPTFRDRIVQKCLCDNYLVPLLYNGLIYDNSATLEGRGVYFALDRFKKHLLDFKKKHDKGYVLVFDFSNYFASINHKILYSYMDPKIKDEDLKNLIHMFIDDFKEGGLGLGSQVSQICAVFYLSVMDHRIKDYYRVKGYGRYMDDGYLILKDIDEVNKFKKIICDIAKELKLQINEKKFKVIPTSNSITFLKHRYKFYGNKLVIKSNRKATTKMRQKMKILAKQHVDLERMTIMYHSKKGELEKFNNYKTLRNLDKLYENIVKDYESKVICT